MTCYPVRKRDASAKEISPTPCASCACDSCKRCSTGLTTAAVQHCSTAASSYSLGCGASTCGCFGQTSGTATTLSCCDVRMCFPAPGCFCQVFVCACPFTSPSSYVIGPVPASLILCGADGLCAGSFADTRRSAACFVAASAVLAAWLFTFSIGAQCSGGAWSARSGIDVCSTSEDMTEHSARSYVKV